MKKIFLIATALLIALVPTCAHTDHPVSTAQPYYQTSTTVTTQNVCAFYATEVTQDSVFAHSLTKQQYIKLITRDAIATSSNQKVQLVLLKLGAIAWKERHANPVIVGMAVYDSCAGSAKPNGILI